jgi:hypothetical protein
LALTFEEGELGFLNDEVRQYLGRFDAAVIPDCLRVMKVARVLS